MNCKKLFSLLLSLMLLISLVSCSGIKTPDAGTDTAPEASAQTEASVLRGKVDEVKDFMFVVDAEDGEFYAFPYDAANKPEGFENVAVGNNVVITYEGELSVVDNFNGTIVSIEKE